MFFIFSKLVGAVLDVGVLAASAFALAFVLMLFARTRIWAGRIFAGTGIALLLLVVINPGERLEQILEDRFPRDARIAPSEVSETQTPPDSGSDTSGNEGERARTSTSSSASPASSETPIRPAGIIILGGVIDGQYYRKTGRTEFYGTGDRIFEMIRLSHQFPDIPILFTGGDGTLRQDGASEALIVRQWIQSAGLSTARFMYETQSRTTYQNAIMARSMATQNLAPAIADGVWLLVTSAYHMPRSMASFRAAGWQVAAWPVDYRVVDAPYLASLNMSDGISSMNRALKEWVGLTAYYISGRTDEWFPAP